MKADIPTMRIFLTALAFLCLTGALGADSPQILTISGQGLVTFTVETSDLYNFTLQDAVLPFPELGVWLNENGGKVLVGRNRDSSGYLAAKFELTLTSGKEYTLQSTSTTAKVTLVLSPVSWSELKTDLRSGLQPVNKDLGELSWTGSLPLLEIPKQFTITGTSLVGIVDSRGLTVYTKKDGGYRSLGDPRIISNWDSWALGELKGNPLLSYSLPPGGNLRAEGRVEIWNEPDWQQLSNLPRDSTGPLQVVSGKEGTYVAHWQVGPLPELNLMDPLLGKIIPGPVLGLPASSQYRMEAKQEGLWSLVQTAQGTDRWYQIFQFDGKVWTTLNFPVVKNPRMLLTAKGPEPVAGVVDSRGDLLLYRLEENYWTALSAPSDWKYDPRSSYFLSATPAGLTLFWQDNRGFSYRRWREGQWNPPRQFPGQKLLDISVDPSGDGTALLLRQAPSLQLDFYRIP